MTNAKSILETITGFIVLLICGIFITFVYNNSGLKLNEGNQYNLNASFERADGVNIGTSVMISGIKVGKVIEQKLDTTSYNAILRLSIDNNIKIPSDSSVEIISSGLLGDKYVAIVPGADSAYLKNDDYIEFTQSSISIESLISKMVFGLDSGNKKDDDTGCASDENLTCNDDSEDNKEEDNVNIPSDLSSSVG